MPYSEPRILRIELPPDLLLLSLNDRLHHMERANRTKKLRSEAYKAAKAQPFLPFTRCRIRIILRAPDNRKRDFNSGNLALAGKACIDGLVDAGVIADDNDNIVRECSYVRGENLKGHSQLIIQVVEDVCA